MLKCHIRSFFLFASPDHYYIFCQEIIGGKVSKMNVLVTFQFNTVFYLILLANLPLLLLYSQSELSVPDLDLASPVTSGRTGREDRMLRYTQAWLAVSLESVHHMSFLVVIEVSGASGAPTGQHSSIQRELALHCVPLHLQ